VEKNQRHVFIVLSIAIVLTAVLTEYNWKTNKGIIPKSTGMPGSMPSAIPHESIDKITFLNEVFKTSKPPESIGNILTAPAEKSTDDSLNKALKWSMETGNQVLSAWLQSRLAEYNASDQNFTEAARNLVFTASEHVEEPIIAAYLFQQGKRLIDKGLTKNKNNVPLRNALIVYLSEYENSPMQFLGTLKETLAIDSTNVETHFIHLNLLKKSGQWKKAIQKCQKLISLQPQNPIWLYQASDIYGYLGDSTNSKVYLNLGVKADKELKQKK
jgi:tetratricopeptide (TPR) repeat protein